MIKLHFSCNMYKKMWNRFRTLNFPVDLPDPGIEPGSPALQADSLPTELSGKPNLKFKMVCVCAQLVNFSYLQNSVSCSISSLHEAGQMTHSLGNGINRHK